MNNEIDEIFKLLSDDGFKDPGTGVLFFPAYVYTYDPENENKIREQITDLNEKLKRPSNNLNCLLIDVYKEFVDFLRNDSFAGENTLEAIFNMEKENPSVAEEYIRDTAQSDEFLEYMGEKFKSYFEKRTPDKIYLILYGFGSLFPYLRASDLLKNTEKYIKYYKLIVFYPGKYDNSHYSLFGILNDENLYRANRLNTLIP